MKMYHYMIFSSLIQFFLDLRLCVRNRIWQRMVSIVDIAPHINRLAIPLSKYVKNPVEFVKKVNDLETRFHISSKKPGRFVKITVGQLTSVHYDRKVGKLVKKYIRHIETDDMLLLKLLFYVRVRPDEIQNSLSGEAFRRVLLKLCESLLGGHQESKKAVLDFIREEVKDCDNIGDAIEVLERLKTNEFVKNMKNIPVTREDDNIRVKNDASAVVTQTNSYVTKENIPFVAGQSFIRENRQQSQTHQHTRNNPSLDVMMYYCDNFSSHMSAEFQTFCDKHNILLNYFPANMTYSLQPVDLTMNAPVKNVIRQIWARAATHDAVYGRPVDDHMGSIDRQLYHYKYAHDQVSKGSIIRGFLKMYSNLDMHIEAIKAKFNKI